jgi:hypothetical protein
MAPFDDWEGSTWWDPGVHGEISPEHEASLTADNLQGSPCNNCGHVKRWFERWRGARK